MKDTTDHGRKAYEGIGTGAYLASGTTVVIAAGTEAELQEMCKALSGKIKWNPKLFRRVLIVEPVPQPSTGASPEGHPQPA